MSAHTCYWNISGISPASVGPPAKLGVTVSYVIADTVQDQFDICDSTGGYQGTATANIGLPVTQAQIILDCEAAIQAAETSYPGLVFVPALE